MDIVSNSTNEPIVIIGGGVIGLCNAYYLSKVHRNIIVVDNGEITDSCSFGNMGYLSPSHFIPIASPGIIREGLRYMLDSKSPFYIKPRLNVSLAEWMLKFYRSSSISTVEKNSPSLSALLNLSRALMNEIREDIGDDFDMEDKGCLMMCHSQKAFEKECNEAKEGVHFGLETETLNRQEVQNLEPDVEIDVTGAVLFKSDAHIQPGKFMRAMYKYLQAKGVGFQLNTEVNDIEKLKDNSFDIKTDTGSIKAKQIILCTGSWLPKLAKKLGIKLLVQPGKGYSVTYQNVEKNIHYPAILVDGRCALTPWKHELRIGGTMEISGINKHVLFKRMEGIYDSVKKFYPGLKIELPAKENVWTGLRPVTPDGLPYIGRPNGYENVFISGGHAMLGVSAAAASGLLISELFEKKTPSINMDAFSVNRF
jgi:D-amino-acid dehydrogenase